MKKVLILIPSRMSAKRLPGKPLLKINNSNAQLPQYDMVDPTSDGFQLATTDSAHNSNNVNYVYYAHA